MHTPASRRTPRHVTMALRAKNAAHVHPRRLNPCPHRALWGGGAHGEMPGTHILVASTRAHIVRLCVGSLREHACKALACAMSAEDAVTFVELGRARCERGVSSANLGVSSADLGVHACPA